MYEILYIMSGFLATAYQPFWSTATVIPRAEEAWPEHSMGVEMTRFIRASLMSGIAAVASSIGHSSAFAEPQEPPVTKSLQGNPGNEAWKSDPYLHALYDISIGAFAKGVDEVDLPAYQQAFYAIIRAKAFVGGADAEKMIDHIKDIPHQMVGIVKDDPKTLDSYDGFVLALVGPK